jgi:hypothetical protein
MRATSAFADEDWEDIEMTVPNLEDFEDPQPSTDPPPSTDPQPSTKVTLKCFVLQTIVKV